jgi:hypothetical protein
VSVVESDATAVGDGTKSKMTAVIAKGLFNGGSSSNTASGVNASAILQWCAQLFRARHDPRAREIGDPPLSQTAIFRFERAIRRRLCGALYSNGAFPC